MSEGTGQGEFFFLANRWNAGVNFVGEASLSLRLHAVLQMLSNETFITFRVRASASSLTDWHKPGRLGGVHGPVASHAIAPPLL